jgi:competence ComEA-like helix-hairpin-helix protein
VKDICLEKIYGTFGLLVLSILIFSSNFYFKLMQSGQLIAVPYSDEAAGTIIVEVTGDISGRGIYFLPVRTTLPALLLDIGIQNAVLNEKSAHHLFPKNFSKLTVSSGSGMSQSIEYGRMSNAKRFSLKKPMNLNSVTEEELILVPGIGKRTAENIIAFRRENHRFQKIEDLLLIRGIKDKKLAHFRKYLSVE